MKQPFTQRLIRLPLAIVFPRTSAEVSDLVKFVRAYDFSVSIRSGNNSYEGLSTLNDIVIDLTFLNIDGETQFEIHPDPKDPEQSTVRVASGVRLGVLYTVVPMVWWSVFCELDKDDPLASGARILKEWQGLAKAPPTLSGSVFAATAEPSAGINSHGWYRVEDDRDPDPEKTLRGLLDELWLGHLPPDVERKIFTAPARLRPLLLRQSCAPCETATAAAAASRSASPVLLRQRLVRAEHRVLHHVLRIEGVLQNPRARS